MRHASLIVGFCLVISTGAMAAEDSRVAGACMTCHKEKSPGLYKQWFDSDHAAHNVTCLSCHQAQQGDADAYTHYDATIATLVTPKDCGRCHPKAADEVGNSYHASAGKILDSADAYLAHVAAGDPVAILGCESCHGSKVQIDKSSPNKLHRKSWPNSGIGRINPDGSLGSCNACHTRHSFSKAQARQPEACSKCHLGPDHPQKEIYEESKHGNTFFTNEDLMNLRADSWVVGIDYSAAPTCASCHMSATKTQGVTHDVGQRIAWTLRPPVSKHKDNHEVKRANMQDVCTACHTKTFTDGHFYQFDASVRLYNEKFAIPATELMKIVREKKLLENPASFSNKIEWTYWEIWHHEGRRARHGAAMMGPDYTWWHGFYEVAQHFYFKLLPEARELGDPDVDAFIDELLSSDPMHEWVREQTDDLTRQIRSGEMQKIYARFFETEGVSMLSSYLDFVRAVSLDRLGRVGVILVTTSFVSFVVMQIGMLLGIVTNAYVGLIVYLGFPVLFVLGLIIIPLAWYRQHRRTGLSTEELLEQNFGPDGVKGRAAGSRVFRTVAILTLGNVLILGVASIKMLHFMDSAEFCGTACHSVMSPEWTTYQASPHARVACVECHVGEGVGALVDSKLNGAWQMVSATFDLYERPIPTPVHQLRPARETCEKCHWPKKFYGSRLQTRVRYEDDETSTPRYTTLNIKIDPGAAGNTGVHWHVDPSNEVRYASVDDQRKQMIWVESHQSDGTIRRFVNTAMALPDPKAEDLRTMDCVDCHNRATHIYQEPDRAVDEKIRLGAIDRSLPYIRREVVKAVRGGYPSLETAEAGIRAGIESFYRRGYPNQASAWYDRIDKAVISATEVWARNIHPGMSIEWGAYPSFLGHSDTPGCFRCHTRDLRDGDGRWISDDCTLCHSILAYGESTPFAYLEAVEEMAPNGPMHEFLRDEFLTSIED